VVQAIGTGGIERRVPQIRCVCGERDRERERERGAKRERERESFLCKLECLVIASVFTCFSAYIPSQSILLVSFYTAAQSRSPQRITLKELEEIFKDKAFVDEEDIDKVVVFFYPSL